MPPSCAVRLRRTARSVPWRLRRGTRHSPSPCPPCQHLRTPLICLQSPLRWLCPVRPSPSLLAKGGRALEMQSRIARAIPTPSPDAPSSTSRRRPWLRRCLSRARFQCARQRRTRCAPHLLPLCQTPGKPFRETRSTCAPQPFLLYYLPRGDSFSGFVNAIIAYSGKVSPPFLLSWKFISSLFYRTLTDIWDNLSRISRDKGVPGHPYPGFSQEGGWRPCWRSRGGAEGCCFPSKGESREDGCHVGRLALSWSAGYESRALQSQ